MHHSEQLRLARNFYQLSPGPAKAKLHLLHLIGVETRIARGHGPTKKAMARLQTRGLSRPDALIAIANAVQSVTRDFLAQDAEQRAQSEARENQVIAML